MRIFLGVDAGNSKTFALTGRDTGELLGFGKGGPGNHQTAGGIEGAMCGIAAAVEGTGVCMADVSHAAFCLAGADFPSDFDLLTGAIAAQWPGLSFTVMNDSFAGLRAGSSRGWGVVSVAGAGTNQCGIGKDGRRLQVGGLGRLTGDYGGAADLGHEAIARAFRAAELRGPATVLSRIVPEHFGCDSTAQLSEAFYKGLCDEAELPRLAPKVFAAATAGDAVAQEILISMGAALGESAGGVIRQLGLEQDDVEVVLAGSVWKGENPLMIDAFRLALHRAAPKARPVRPRYEPVVGAWLLAAEQAGAAVRIDMLEATLPPEIPMLKEAPPLG